MVCSVAKIHYFQRYASVENTVTNNTLQLLARIYGYSPIQASEFLTQLTGESIEIGIEINQQERGNGSIPDAAIIQRSFKVLVEAKVDAPPHLDQLLRHSDNFTSEDQKILLLLTREPVGALEEQIRRSLSNRQADVLFKNITYEAICRTATSLFQEYEYEMRELVSDYVDYCNEVGLFDQSGSLLRIVPCGNSFDINLRHGVYFHPSDRGYTKHQYVGVYKDKAVRALWEVDSVFDVNVENGHLDKTLVRGRETDDYDARLLSIIKDAEQECGYEISTGHRFFCGQPLETDFAKASPGGIMGARFINLKEVIGDFVDAADIARKLDGSSWT
jgi:hypothetical protein